MSYCAPKDHDWQPIATWPGRYVCSKCDVYGYRGVASVGIQTGLLCGQFDAQPEALTATYQSLATTIIPYLCTFRKKVDGAHEACGNPAIRSLGRQQRCWVHKKKKH